MTPSAPASTHPPPLQTGEAKLSEVKGPRDRLSDSQRAWMLALADVDMQVGEGKRELRRGEGQG